MIGQIVIGISLFLFGMVYMSDGMKHTGVKVKNVLKYCTKNRFVSFLTGLFSTMLVQSSSVTTSILVGLVNSGVLTVKECLGAVVGANISTTVTSWIIALEGILNVFKPSNLVVFLLPLGITLKLFLKKDWAKAIIGLSILFVGMIMVKDAVAVLKGSEMLTSAMTEMSNPAMGILVGFVITVIIQSSSASTGILQVLAMAGLVTTPSAIFLCLGINLGTTITAVLSSLAGNKKAKKLATFHVLFNVTGAIIFSLFLLFVPIKATTVTALDISIYHTIFNITTAIIVLPLTNYYHKFINKMFKVLTIK